MSAFERATAVDRVATGTYRATIDDAWWVVRGPHGGYLAAIILRALIDALDDPARPIRSFTTHFISAPARGEFEIETQLERSGRSMSYLSARMKQEGKTFALSLAAFSGAWSGLEFNTAAMPDVPSPADSFEVPFEGEGVPNFLQNIEMRWNQGAKPFSGADEALVGGWFRMREPVIADAPVIAALLDAWAPAIFPVATEPVIAPTIDLTMHFRAPLPVSGARADDFYLGRFGSSLGREGFFEEDGQIWSPDGNLIAQSRQLALGLTVRPPS
jgi:acyl-CoA thioesterase